MFNSLTAINFPLRESLREITHSDFFHVLYLESELILNIIMEIQTLLPITIKKH